MILLAAVGPQCRLDRGNRSLRWRFRLLRDDCSWSKTVGQRRGHRRQQPLPTGQRGIDAGLRLGAVVEIQ